MEQKLMAKALNPKPNKPEQDIVYTPRWLSQAIINYYNPTGAILDPCKGGGAFSDYMECDWCELSLGVDFLAKDESKHYDWIVTNPPWSMLRQFIEKSVKISDNIVFLINFNALTTRKRLSLIHDNGFYIAEVLMLDNPTESHWPSTGFQLAAVHLKRGAGTTTWSKLN
jgi:hypothetical protein